MRLEIVEMPPTTKSYSVSHARKLIIVILKIGGRPNATI